MTAIGQSLALGTPTTNLALNIKILIKILYSVEFVGHFIKFIAFHFSSKQETRS